MHLQTKESLQKFDKGKTVFTYISTIINSYFLVERLWIVWISIVIIFKKNCILIRKFQSIISTPLYLRILFMPIAKKPKIEVPSCIWIIRFAAHWWLVFYSVVIALIVSWFSIYCCCHSIQFVLCNYHQIPAH